MAAEPAPILLTEMILVNGLNMLLESTSVDMHNVHTYTATHTGGFYLVLCHLLCQSMIYGGKRLFTSMNSCVSLDGDKFLEMSHWVILLFEHHRVKSTHPDGTAYCMAVWSIPSYM